jgi:hypothetical protein
MILIWLNSDLSQVKTLWCTICQYCRCRPAVVACDGKSLTIIVVDREGNHTHTLEPRSHKACKLLDPIKHEIQKLPGSSNLGGNSLFWMTAPHYLVKVTTSGSLPLHTVQLLWYIAFKKNIGCNVMHMQILQEFHIQFFCLIIPQEKENNS